MSGPATGSDARGLTLGRYRLEARIGRGGMCDVYRATVLSGEWSGRSVAIKRLSAEMSKNPQAVDRFLTEADIASMLRHPNIVQVLEAAEIGESHYMAMEFVDGRDMGVVIDRCRAERAMLPVDFAVHLVSVLLSALEVAHEARSRAGRPLLIVHCDVSPGNVFISKQGEIKLGDFGVAQVRSLEPSPDGIWGKPYYLSPETFEGAPPAPAMDLWAAAVMLYELLTNVRPFSGASVDDVSAAVRGGRLLPPRELRPEIREELSNVVMTALSREPDRRYASAGKFRAALAGFLDERMGTQNAIASLIRALFGEVE
jgi:serine/threonine-protein kinase